MNKIYFLFKVKAFFFNVKLNKWFLLKKKGKMASNICIFISDFFENHLPRPLTVLSKILIRKSNWTAGVNDIGVNTFGRVEKFQMARLELSETWEKMIHGANKSRKYRDTVSLNFQTFITTYCLV